MTTQFPAIPAPERAKMFAELAHANQTYNDEVPYSYHLGKVVEVLGRFGYSDPVMVCAGWLHDSIEDTNRSFNDIKNRFGTDVAELVYAVTSELGRNRKERNSKTYPKIQGNSDATALKLADRIANVEYGMASGGKDGMYAKEHAEFEAAIRDINNLEDPRVTRMWAYLGQLLRSVEPK